MSTVPNAPSGPAVKGAATEAAKEALHDHLRKTASFIKILDLLVAMFSWICGGLLLWFVACLIDHWIYPLPPLGRWFFWLVGVGVTAWWTSSRVLPLALRRINLIYAAQRIENLVPEFKNGLISWLELEELPQHGVPKGVMAALTYRAKRYIGGQDPSATVDTSLLIKLLGCMLLLTVGMVMYSMASPKSVATTGKRILFPWTTLTAPARVEILKVEPGSTEITHGKPLQVEAELKGLKPGEPVMLRFSTLDGQVRDRELEFEPITEGFRYGITLITSERGVEQELDYWVEAGDALAGPYRVSLNPLPTVVLDSVQLEYPAYTGLKPRTILAGG
ncbi:MAG: hypothetical protein VXZ82_11095 [Planctomycetota bacterium]|nr:hypothetical protein [Planctomycetota bacterium]